MRILMTVPYQNEGGVASFCNSIQYHFKKSHIEIFQRGTRGKELSKFKNIINSFKTFYQFYRLVNTKELDIVFINTSFRKATCMRDGVLIIIAKLLKKKILLFVHGFDEKCLKYKIFLKIYNLCDQIVVLANDFKDKLISNGCKSKIFVSLNPVSNDIIDSITKQDIDSRKNRKPQNILFLSRIEVEKGILIVLQTFLILKGKYPFLKLFVAGTGTSLELAKKFMKDHQLTDVFFLGFVQGEAKIDLLKKSDIFLFPSYNEGLPINVLEAMIAGLPVVTRPVGGIYDFFENGKMGYAIESLQPEDFAVKVEELINSENYEDICRENYIYSRQNFTPETITTKLERIIEENFY